MSLKVGGLDVVGVFVGDAAAKVYVGAMKIWPPVPDFTPFTISSEDPGYEDLIDEQVPEGASGCWVTLIGGGGSGGTGRRFRAGFGRSGGGGGGGGAKVSRVWVPKSSLGSTYTVLRGLGGAAVTDLGSSDTDGKPGNAGGSSLFSSGGVQLTAGGGGAGGGGTRTSGSAGSGGTAVAIGVSATVANGSAGGAGDYDAAGGAGVNNTSGGAAGGGGGGGGDGSTSYNGGRGGNVSSANGGAGATASAYPRSGPDQAAGQPGPGGGGDRISAPRPPRAPTTTPQVTAVCTAVAEVVVGPFSPPPMPGAAARAVTATS
ncbi:minor tail protein [Mycobacterium phage Marcell]|uniref:Glycine-rich domain-containing protein n=2 Tax=Fromanvirus TaxID=186764 RepID=K0G8U5_9CAUD|nr:minor tail protein [Mycobacterium phage Marcell]AFU20793.1 hypothetical protein MARCELL_35 [Mycobacterium phage Marcell]